jgi:KaiC/GvpD/RAD55 family RecA-like ATPase
VRAKAYSKSYAEVKELETRAARAKADLQEAEERLAARQKKMKTYEAELTRRSQQQLAERKGIAGQKERLASQEARLNEREAALFDLESSPDFAREALAALEPDLGSIAPRPPSAAKVGGAISPATPPADRAAAAPKGGQGHPAGGRLSLGNERLDELIGGGLPTGASLLVVGPAFCGKEAIPLGFVADGLERGIPAIIVTTVRSPAELVDELELMLSAQAKHRVRSHLRWVDASGKGQRGNVLRDHIVEVMSPADFGKIKAAIADHFDHLGGKHPAFRFVYMPLTESWRHAEPEVARAFLQQLVAAVRKQQSGAIFVAESGIHSSDEVEALAGMMGGVIRCQEERDGHALRTQGVPGTRTQKWVQYRHRPKGIELGSFELERIR